MATEPPGVFSPQHNLQSSNRQYAEGFKHGDLPLPPGRAYLVVTCMDARIDPAQAFGMPGMPDTGQAYAAWLLQKGLRPLLLITGIELGDAHVIRRALSPCAGATAQEVASEA